MQVLQVPFFSSAYGPPSMSSLKLCSSLCNSVFARAVPRYPFSLCDELQHPEHASVIRDPYGCGDGEQMAAPEEQAWPGNSSYESCIINSCLSTTRMKLFKREPCYEEVDVVHSRKGRHLLRVYCLILSLEYTNSAKSHPTLAKQALFSHSSQRCLTAPHLAHIICCPFHMCLFAIEFRASKSDCTKEWPWIWSYFCKFMPLILHWK